MKAQDNIITVDIEVSKPLREYILSINKGDDVLVPDKKSLLWSLVKTQLDLVPNNYHPVRPEDRQRYIKIGFLESHSSYSYNANIQKTINLNTLFRCYLNPSGQKKIAAYLTRSMKMVYRAYVGGALSNNPSLTIHDAIYEFCQDYGITLEHITYEMFRKDWYRFKQKNGDQGVIPIESHNL